MLSEYWHNYSVEPLGKATGVPGVVGRTTTFRIGIYSQPNTSRAQVFRLDGRPLTGEYIPWEYRQVGSDYGASTTLGLDANGQTLQFFDSPGFWNVNYKWRDGDPGDVRFEPYFSARGIAAASSLLPADKIEPARITARHFGPGSLAVELKDIEGKPARGYVNIVGSGSLEPEFMGSTDESGVVRFEGISSWKYTVHATIEGRPSIDLENYVAPLPGDERLQNGTTVFSEPFTPEPNTERKLVMRERAVGYVRGRIKPPPGQSPKDFVVSLTEDDTARGAQIMQRGDEGEFVAGPFAAGRVQLHTWDKLKRVGFRWADCGTRVVAVKAGKVARVEIIPEPKGPSPLAGRGDMLIGAGGASTQATGSESLVGRVLLSDGKTPALGAIVMYFAPGQWQPILGGMTDARGQIHAKGLMQWANGDQTSPPDDPPGYMIVAHLPGGNGAAFAAPPQPDKPLEVILPPARSIRGRVTVGGASPAGKMGSIRVFAAYEGKGDTRFGAYLNVQTTAHRMGPSSWPG